jgi:hypothetical protein
LVNKDIQKRRYETVADLFFPYLQQKQLEMTTTGQSVMEVLPGLTKTRTKSKRTYIQ